MRKITDKVVRGGFQIGKAVKLGNTLSTGDKLYLYGNRIAYRKDGKLYITIAEWSTSTTRERLSAIYGVKVTQRKGQLYLNGMKWDGNEVCVDDFMSR